MTLEINNGVSYILEVEWMPFVELELDTDSVRGIGVGFDCYLLGQCAYLKWPNSEPGL